MKATLKPILPLVVSIYFGAIANAQDSSKPSGEFSGKSDHVVTGKASVEKNSDGSYQVVLDDDFSLDNAPDPKVGLGNDGYKLKLAKLQKLKGKQIYAVPADVKISEYNEVWIWCEKFNVPLGLAKLK